MQKLKLLIVDDEVGMGLAVERALRAYVVRVPEMDLEIGFDVTRLETGEEALSAIENSPPDILLLDHKLPGISGLDVLAHLSKGTYDLLTVMITAYASLENAVLATKRGAFDFLAKPFTPDELRSVVYKTAKHLLLQRQAIRLSEEKKKVRFEFISVLSHELKAPLAAVEQYLGLLGGMSLGEDAEAMIRRSILRIQGMRKLILDLLDLTHIESGQRKRKVEALDLGNIIMDAVELITPRAEERRITIHRHGSENVSLPGDRWEVETMITNLLSNAVKYNREGGRVDIDLTEDKDTVCIAFQDTGCGIPPESLQTLFREFSRIRNEATEHVPGSGLGLSIIKKIASLYDGDIEVGSTPGEGSRFTLVLKTGERHTA